jgi:hypothetical protein
MIFATVLVVAVSQARCASAEEDQGVSQAEGFWDLPALFEDLPHLSPAKVQLVSTPNRERRFATFELGGRKGPQDYKTTNPVLRPFATVEEMDYRIEKFSSDVMPWVDRKYRVESLPHTVKGLPLLRTRMGHKGIVDGRFALVLELKEPAYVFLAVDERAIDTYKRFGTPNWMRGFAPTGLRVVTDDPIMKQTSSGFAVFAKKAPKGELVLGPSSCNPYKDAMYFAFFGTAE